MAKKKKVPFHIQNNLKQYSYEDGGLTITFWAKDEQDAKFYLDKTEKNIFSLKEVEVKSV
jgi:hypothetical protein